MINRLWQYDNNAKVCFFISFFSALREKHVKINLYAIFDGVKIGELKKCVVQKHVDIEEKLSNDV